MDWMSKLDFLGPKRIGFSRNCFLALLSLMVFGCSESRKTTIFLQLFSDFSNSDAKKIQSELSKVYADVKILPKIGFPKDSWNAAKTRHRADSIIHFLERRTPENQLIIGLTNKDISTTKGNFKDWGVMGLGFCPGKSCVASTFGSTRKRNPNNSTKSPYMNLGIPKACRIVRKKLALCETPKAKTGAIPKRDFAIIVGVN
jgi:archaemetzincin